MPRGVQACQATTTHLYVQHSADTNLPYSCAAIIGIIISSSSTNNTRGLILCTQQATASIDLPDTASCSCTVSDSTTTGSGRALEVVCGSAHGHVMRVDMTQVSHSPVVKLVRPPTTTHTATHNKHRDTVTLTAQTVVWLRVCFRRGCQICARLLPVPQVTCQC